MKTKHRKAARHKRKWLADPMASINLLSKVVPYSAGEQARLGIQAYDAFNTIISGKGRVHDLDTLAITTNVCLVLSEQVHPECVEVCLRAGQSIIAAKNRWRQFGRTGFDGVGVQNVRDLLDLHDQYLQNITPAQHASAYRETLRRIEAGNFLEEIETA